MTNRYNIPHGEACGLTLDYFTRLNGKHDSRVQTLAHDLGFADSDALADAIVQLKADTGLRCSLQDLNLSEDEVTSLVTASHHPNMDNNPYPVTDDILYDLYQELVKV